MHGSIYSPSRRSSPDVGIVDPVIVPQPNPFLFIRRVDTETLHQPTWLLPATRKSAS